MVEENMSQEFRLKNVSETKFFSWRKWAKWVNE